jgi:hypothetical protein
MSSVLEAKKRMLELLGNLPGIAGIGIGWDDKGRACVRVNVNPKIDQASRRKIPSSVDGVPVKVEQVGPIQTE